MENGEFHRLIDALVVAFPGYLERRFAELGVVADPALASAVDAGCEQLRTNLEDLLNREAPDQEESPLELVRRATRPVSAALEERGVATVDRDVWEAAAHPEDRYALYPASSRALGEEAWRLHLEWGVRKAAAVAGVVPAREGSAVVPSVALFGISAGQRPALQEAIEARDFRVVIWRNPAALEEAARVRPVLTLVDLSHPEAHRAIRDLAGKGSRVVAVGEGVDDLTVPGIMALGAEDVVASSRLFSRLDQLLPSRA